SRCNVLRQIRPWRADEKASRCARTIQRILEAVMTQPADSPTLSPFMFGEVFFAGAVAMQRQIAESIMTVFDAVADAMSDSLHATAALAHGIGNAQRPSEAAAAGAAWFQGRVEKA